VTQAPQATLVAHLTVYQSSFAFRTAAARKPRYIWSLCMCLAHYTGCWRQTPQLCNK